MFQGRRHMQKPRNLARLNPDIPIYLFSGTDDPVHGGLGGINILLEEYRDRGCLIETRFYDKGRHEMLNEINKDEVINDLIDWLDRYFAPTSE
jgi:alpha-beta hydrolase superfamily lysophospholipase